MNHGLVYTWSPALARGPAGGLRLERVNLPRLGPGGPEGPALAGQFVRIRNAGWIDADTGDGGVRYVPIGSARPNENGDFEFPPHCGGERVDRGPLRDPVRRRTHTEAAHFGEVNAYFHLDRIAAYVAELLAELGAPAPPRVTAVVCAHDGSPPGGGARIGSRVGAFQGGHYRLPRSCHDIPEPPDLEPTGEIHLGPGRRMMTGGALAEAAGGRPYRHNAAHNAGTLYHEYGHHLQRHTSDFRANGLRPASEQSNRKTATEEGTCDYWAAAMLESPHIWAWHHRHDAATVHRRSLVSRRTMADFDHRPEADPHRNGTIWAAALWDFRVRMATMAPDGARLADRLVLQALRNIGARFGPEVPPTARGASRARAGFGTALAALLDAEQLLHGGRFRPLLVSCFGLRGIHPGDARAPAPATLEPRGAKVP